MLAYLGDLLTCAHSVHQAMLHTNLLLAHLHSLGFTINWQKSALSGSEHCVLRPYFGLSLFQGTSFTSKNGILSELPGAILQAQISSLPPVPQTAM